LEEDYWHIVTKMKKTIKKEIVIPGEVVVNIDGTLIIIKGPIGEISRRLAYPGISIDKKENKIIVFSKDGTKKEKTMIGTFTSHIKNMIKGCKEPFVYKLRICSGHFPMNVQVKGNEVIVSNFLGEKIPRRTKIEEGSNVEVKGNEVIVSSYDKEKAGMSAARIEQTTRIRNRDRRVFQDGIFLISKAGKDIK